MPFCLSLRFSHGPPPTEYRCAQMKNHQLKRPLDSAAQPCCSLAEDAGRLDRDSGEYKHSPLLLPDYSILSHLYSGLFWNQFFPGILIDERLCASVIGDHLPSIRIRRRLKACKCTKMRCIFKGLCVRFWEKSTKKGSLRSKLQFKSKIAFQFETKIIAANS